MASLSVQMPSTSPMSSTSLPASLRWPLTASASRWRLCLVLGYDLVKTADVLTEPLAEPPPSNRNRAADAPPPENARGQGRRVDLEPREEPLPNPSGTKGASGRQRGKKASPKETKSKTRSGRARQQGDDA
jgi:hypothetical protein